MIWAIVEEKWYQLFIKEIFLCDLSLVKEVNSFSRIMHGSRNQCFSFVVVYGSTKVSIQGNDKVMSDSKVYEYVLMMGEYENNMQDI